MTKMAKGAFDEVERGSFPLVGDGFDFGGKIGEIECRHAAGVVVGAGDGIASNGGTSLMGSVALADPDGGGLFVPLTAKRARMMAAGLMAMADYLEGKKDRKK